ncbi:MAG: Hsp20 family protein [Clostridiales bacterium]|nr:Hsp20 family protein [Clostridiales bacterium]
MSENREENKNEYIYNERRWGCAQRSFTLNDINEDGIAAEYKDGVLRLTLPKLREPAKAARSIEIK